jgi:hypothetical protein
MTQRALLEDQMDKAKPQIIDVVDPEKMLAYLKGRASRLEVELAGLRTQLCRNVADGNMKSADDVMDKILWKTAAQMAALDEYLQGQVYADTLKVLNEREAGDA